MTQPNKPHTVHIETFGCQMNEYDSELVRSLLRKAGFEFTEDRERADVMLMNTCAIRENAHNKVYGHLAELKAVKEQRPLVVGVLGCMAQNLKEELTEKQPLVDVLVGPDGYRHCRAQRTLSACLGSGPDARPWRARGRRNRLPVISLGLFPCYVRGNFAGTRLTK